MRGCNQMCPGLSFFVPKWVYNIQGTSIIPGWWFFVLITGFTPDPAVKGRIWLALGCDSGVTMKDIIVIPGSPTGPCGRAGIGDTNAWGYAHGPRMRLSDSSHSHGPNLRIAKLPGICVCFGSVRPGARRADGFKIHTNRQLPRPYRLE